MARAPRRIGVPVLHRGNHKEDCAYVESASERAMTKLSSHLEIHIEKLRFDWADLPAITAHLQGTGGTLRESLEDFFVAEIPSYLPSGSGSHAYALIEKRGLTTRDLINALKEQGIRERDIGVAGQKDKYAVTQQWISVPDESAKSLEALDEINGVRILAASRHKNKLGLGHLRGNRFEVRIRDAEPDCVTRAEVILDELKAVGLPNYFGPQRFGRFNTNIEDAMRLVRGESVPGGRGLHRFFLAALQSHLFNWMLKNRIERGLYASVLTGDMAQKHDTGGVFCVEQPDVENPRAERIEISATLPMYGKKVRVSTSNAGDMEREALDYFGLKWIDFRRLRGDRRNSRVRLDDISIEPTEDGYLVKFTLPKGSFATSLLREFMKVEPE